MILHLLILFIGILIVLFIMIYNINKQFALISDKISKQADIIKSKQDKIDAFLLPTYNNSIRISKKLGVYYQYNKEDYENHKNK